MTDVKLPSPELLKRYVAALEEIQKKGGATVKDDFCNWWLNLTSVANAHKTVQLGFLRKVYGLLSAQLVLTIVVASSILMMENVNAYMKESPGILTLLTIGSFASLVGLRAVRTSVPANYILLGVFTLFESLMVGVIASQYEKAEVLEAFVLTASVTIALTLYTLQSRYDYSCLGAGLFAALWVLILAGILQVFVQSEVFDLILCICGALVFCIFIVVDTDMAMDTHSAEDYVIAAVDLYLDILNLFIFILRIFGKKGRK